MRFKMTRSSARSDGGLRIRAVVERLVTRPLDLIAVGQFDNLGSSATSQGLQFQSYFSREFF
jgi:hypothetical protein